MPSTSGEGWPTAGEPVVDMIEHSERTRCGKSIATCWAIIPPIEAPTMCALSIPSASSSPAVSAAMSGIPYGTPEVSPDSSAPKSGGGASIRVDSPMSRLSKRTTRYPDSAIASQNGTGQPVSWVPSPITSSSGSAEGSPKVSYSSSTPGATVALGIGWLLVFREMRRCAPGGRTMATGFP